MRFQLDFVPFTSLGKILYTALKWIGSIALIAALILSRLKNEADSSGWISSVNTGAILIGVIVLILFVVVLFLFMSIRE